MFEVLSAHAGALSALVGAVIAVVVLTAWWESISLSAQSAWHSLPFIGGIAWLARRQRRPSGQGNYSDTTAVLALSGSYARFIRVLSRADYDNYMNYLRKAGDLGRGPFPPLLRVVFFCMVLVEAAVLAYVLAGWTLPGASEVAQQLAAFGIGFLIAVILVFFTHWAGLEIYQANQFRRDRKEWIAAGRVGPLYGPDLSLNDAQNVDDNEPAFRQRATRGHGNKTYALSAITVIMVIVVGIGAAFVRGQVIEQELVLESAQRAKGVQRFNLDATAANHADAAVSELQAIQQEEINIKRRGGWATLIILSIIFFFLQLLGIFFGYRYSFNGRLSKDAYRALKADRFSSYSELLQYYDRVADIAQSKVERLQQLIEQKYGDRMGDSPQWRQYTFRDYLQQRELQRRDKPLGGDPVPSPSGISALLAIPRANELVSVAAQVPFASASNDLPPKPRSTPDPIVPSPQAVPVAEDDDSTQPGLDTLVDLKTSAKARLEQAEAVERKRAADRLARNRAAARRKDAAKAEPEAD
jgi:hypothetical protein